jgi:hypothetical protein
MTTSFTLTHFRSATGHPAAVVARPDEAALRVDSPDGRLRGLMFGCACHNTTLTGKHYKLSADYAGFAQACLRGVSMAPMRVI